ncbi:MAG: hypothetical protein LKG19_12410 [Saprospiraceae bacterium]|nr:hypothetical protein [Saprospiraceae bacterium]
MNFFSFGFMCLMIGIFLFFELSASSMPDILWKLNFWISWIFIVWASYTAGRVIVDCLKLSGQGQMSSENVSSSILLSILHILPTLAISIFMLKEGFK